MVNTNEVFRKIKEISKRSVNPRPQVLVQLVAQELSASRENIMPSLRELKEMRLIQLETVTSAHLRLTLLGHTVTR